MVAVYKRELRAYFTSPVGYVFVAVYLAANGFLFAAGTLLAGSSASMPSYFVSSMFLMAVLIPLLTMRLFSDDRKLRTEQLLLTSPVSLTGMVLGKALAAYTVFACTFAVGCANLSLLYRYGAPSGGTLAGYCIALLLLGAAFVAVGVFVSSLTQNQITAAIGTMLIIILFATIGMVNQYIPFEWLRSIVAWFSIYSRFTNFTYGVFDISAVVYYASIAAVFIFLTVRVYEKRRWE